MLKRISAVSAAVAGALLIGAAAQAEDWRRDAFPDPSPPSSIVQSGSYDSSERSDMERVYGRHFQPE